MQKMAARPPFFMPSVLRQAVMQHVRLPQSVALLTIKIGQSLPAGLDRLQIRRDAD
jgi:hypothetical protein